MSKDKEEKVVRPGVRLPESLSIEFKKAILNSEEFNSQQHYFQKSIKALIDGRLEIKSRSEMQNGE